MPIKYYDLGGLKKLHEIVMVGTHDAAITRGHGNVQTQTLNILQQATAGVRFFDLRIAAAKVAGAPGQPKGAELQAYHGSLSTKTKTRAVTIGGVTQNRQVERSTMKYEGWGLLLNSILQDARVFVGLNPTEFLLLKFDKCKNWELIAEACVASLGNTLYSAGGHLNTKDLNDLQGKVVVLFSPDGLAEIAPAQMNARLALLANPGGAAAANMDSITCWQNLQKETTPAYNPGVPGLQYYGGFGESMMSPTTNKKISKNVTKQVNNMTSARLQDRRVMRMMYWTTTGILQNIQDRNREMWQPPNLRRFLAAWDSGLSATVSAHAPLYGPMLPGAATQIRDYFPNIIMIDFADDDKSSLIFNLNMLTTGQVAQGATLIGMRAAMG
jgi:hypothetical protein